MPLPPGPEQGRLAQTVAFHRDPLRVLRELHGRFGDMFTVRLLPAGPTVVLASAEAARAVPAADPQAAHAGEARRSLLPMASERSVFGGDGEAHRAARLRIGGAFTPEASLERGPAMAEIAMRHVSGWPRRRPFRLLPRMRAIADEIFAREVLGLRGERATALGDAIGSLLWTPGNPPVTIPAKDDGIAGRVVDAGYRFRRRRIAALLEAEIADRRSRGAPGAGVLGLILGDEPAATPDEVVEELLSLMMAAQEPMAAALTWQTLTITGAGLRDRLAEEGMDTAFARAVIREGLRLHPSAGGSLRVLTQPMLGLPAGTSTNVPIPFLHRDPRHFPDPDRFDPSRPEPAEGTYLPFGAGGRSCIAEPLARAMIGAVVPAVLRRFDLRPLGPQPERMVLRATILVPQRSGLAMA